MKAIRSCGVITAILLVLTCLFYPMTVTLAARALFPHQAQGSLIVEGGEVRGSELLGQSFAKPEDKPGYFWGRPSGASTDKDTGLLVSAGSNLGPSNPALHDEIKARVEALRASGVEGSIPADLVTKSASGLDPHISPAAAEVQVARVARERNLPEAEVRQLVAAHTEGRTLGLLGEPRVRVLKLNLALDRRSGR